MLNKATIYIFYFLVLPASEPISNLDHMIVMSLESIKDLWDKSLKTHLDMKSFSMSGLSVSRGRGSLWPYTVAPEALLHTIN